MGRSRSRSISKSRSLSRRRRSRSRSRGGRDGKKSTGVVVSWMDSRGFGFIKPDKGGDDVFCHISSLNDGDALGEGDVVEYEEFYDDRSQKPQARSVTGGRTAKHGQRGRDGLSGPSKGFGKGKGRGRESRSRGRAPRDRSRGRRRDDSRGRW